MRKSMFVSLVLMISVLSAVAPSATAAPPPGYEAYPHRNMFVGQTHGLDQDGNPYVSVPDEGFRRLEEEYGGDPDFFGELAFLGESGTDWSWESIVLVPGDYRLERKGGNAVVTYDRARIIAYAEKRGKEAMLSGVLPERYWSTAGDWCMRRYADTAYGTGKFRTWETLNDDLQQQPDYDACSQEVGRASERYFLSSYGADSVGNRSVGGRQNSKSFSPASAYKTGSGLAKKIYWDLSFSRFWNELGRHPQPSELVTKGGEVFLTIPRTELGDADGYGTLNFNNGKANIQCERDWGERQPSRKFLCQGGEGMYFGGEGNPKDGKTPVEWSAVFTEAGGTKLLNLSRIWAKFHPSPISADDDIHVWLGIENSREGNLWTVEFLWDPPAKKKAPAAPFVANIASPKTVSKEPGVIGLNLLIALAYLLTFYYTAGTFNAAFQENGFRMFASLAGKAAKLPGSGLASRIASSYRSFWSKTALRERAHHKLSVVATLVTLGIVGQIAVDEFDVTTTGWIATVTVLLLALGVVAVLKDGFLYLMIKKEERSGMGMEVIPSGFLISAASAVAVRAFNVVPGAVFGTALRLNPKSSAARRKSSNAPKLFAAIAAAFAVAVVLWGASALISDETSFWYSFALSGYFWIVNDVFLNLLPIGIFWGSVLKDSPKWKWPWATLLLLSTFALFHTVLNPKGDLAKVADHMRDGNVGFLFWVLGFWMLVTVLLSYATKRAKISMRSLPNTQERLK